MSKRKLALKRLTASDLTIFKWHFENKYAGNQKAINLNKDIFIDELYPVLPEAATEKDGRFPLDLKIYGPSGKPEINLQRKIIKHGAYKNWRLNGEFIDNPGDDPERFNELEAGDMVIMDFSGVVPTSSNLIFISRASESEKTLFHELDQLLGDQKMIALTEKQVDNITSVNPVHKAHPIYSITIDEVLEDAVQGGAESADRIWKGVSSGYLSKESLEKARRKAEVNGRIGEQLIYDYLSELISSGDLDKLEWTSEEVNPISPYDFKIGENNRTVLLDVKTTDGEFSRSIHVSMNELRQMANGEERYDIYRVYDIGESDAKFRIAADMKPFAQSVLESIKGLPTGVTPNGFSFNPDKLDFGDEKIITYPEDDPD